MLKLPMHRLQLQAKLLQAANGDAIGMRAQGLGRQHLRQIGVRLLDESATHRRLARGHFIARTFSAAVRAAATRERSEEHTSELQSLMRISYAVFCLKKKKQTKDE